MNTKDINIVGRISHFFTTHGPLSVLFLLTALTFGFVSFYLTPKQYNPEIKRPAFAISLTYSGATIDESLDRVVHEMVEKVSTVPGVEDIYTEVNDGSDITTTVIFEVGHDTTKAKVDLLSQIEQHSYLARGFTSVPHIIEINPETVPVLQIVFGSETLSLRNLREKVVDISHVLVDVENVSDVSVVGGYREALIVELNPSKLETYSITIEEVAQTLSRSQTRAVFEGVENREYQIQVVYDARNTSPEEIGAREIYNGIQIRDVAEVYMGSGTNRSYVLHWSKNNEKNNEVVMLSVSKVEGSSAPNVTQAVRERIESLTGTNKYSDVAYRVVGDDGVVASEEIRGLTKNLITSIVIVAGVLFLFLSVRAALVVLVAIPVTLLIVFGLGYLFGETVNRITLFALILSLGLLVDSAIVVVENIYTKIRIYRDKSVEKETREQAIAHAVHEIGVGLLLSTVTSVIVFLPMRYITGMMGPYMGPIAFFVPAALIVSFLVAIVITPFVASRMFTGEDKSTKLRITVQNLVRKITSYYATFLRSVVTSRKKQQKLLLGALVLFFVSLLLPLIGLVHFQMLPRADQDQFYVYLDMETGTAREKTRLVAESLVEELTESEEVVSVQSFIATPPILDFNGLFKGAQNRTQTNQATLRVNILPSEKRKKSSTEIVSHLRAKIREENPVLHKYIQFIEEPPGPPVRATLVAKVMSENDVIRQKVAENLFVQMKEVQGVVDEDVQVDDPVGRVVYTLSHDATREFKVSEDQVVRAIRLLGGGIEVTEFSSSNSNEYVPGVLALNFNTRNNPSSINTLYVKNSNNTLIPISSLVETSYEKRPSHIALEDATEVIYLTAEVEGRPIIYAVIELMKKIITGELEGYSVTNWNLFSLDVVNVTGNKATIAWGGEWEMTLENFRDLSIAMAVALMLVYTVLVAQYNKFLTPAFILVTVPLGLVGILWGFFVLDTLFGIYLTATALIGFIALIGLVVNNAIIYLEYVEQKVTDGLEYTEALVAAGEARLRPIALTSLTTILGSLTIAGDPVWSGLAWAIVFGLSLSTVLTLVVYPTLLVFFTNKPLSHNT